MARLMVILVMLLAALWGGYWVVGQQLLKQGAGVAEARLRLDGWEISYSDLTVSGFPNRFDTTVTDLVISDPAAFLELQAPFLQVFALSYRPNHIIAVAPPELAVALPAGTAPVSITADNLRASALLTASTAPEVERATLVAETLSLDDPNFGFTLASGQIAVRMTEARTDTFDVAATLTGLRVKPQLHGFLDPDLTLPDTFDLLEIDATAVLPPDSQLGELDLRQATLIWGEIRADLSGTVMIGPDRRPEGALTLDLRGWEAAFDYALRLGLVPADRAFLLRAGLAGMAEGDGTVSAELTFAGGQMRLGAIPLGPAPQL